MINPLSVISSAHIEQFSRGIAALTVDPYKSTLYYFLPFVAAIFSNYQELRSDPSLEAIMPSRMTDPILREIEDLTQAAEIPRTVTPYVALNHQFSSCGGALSITNPALFIPEQHLFRRNPLSSFTQEQPHENLAENLWVFSDYETRFLISRELGQIKESNTLLKVAIKVTILAAIFLFVATPLGFAYSAALFGGAGLMYISSEQFLRQRADLHGTEILSKRIQNAVQVAINTLDKIRRQNLYKREHSNIAKWYITEDGNNLLDFLHPFLTTRIESLRSCARNL